MPTPQTSKGWNAGTLCQPRAAAISARILSSLKIRPSQSAHSEYLPGSILLDALPCGTTIVAGIRLTRSKAD